jgi:tRNA(Ile)-lysidine synthase
VALAVRHGLHVVAHHVDHRLRPESAAEADTAERIAVALGVPFVRHVVAVAPGPNLEARARTARLAVLPEGVLTGHTADDQAETVLLRLLRGSGGDGLSGIAPGPLHPLLGLRRRDTEAVCAELAIEPVRDASNISPAMWRNRVRHELLPLASEIAGRDLVPILARTADLLRDEGAVLDELAGGVDPTDAPVVASAPPAIARRALRHWLAVDGYPPDAASVERVLAVARGEAVACELSDGRRVERSRQRFRIVERDH